MPPDPNNMNAPDFLVESIPNIVHGSPQTRAQNPWLAPIVPLLLSAAAMAICYRAVGATLGLFLGGLFVSALITAPLVAAEDTWLARVLAACGVIHGITVIWLVSALRADLGLGVWAACYLVQSALVLAITGCVALLRAMRFGRIAAGAVATTLSLAWLTWPIWLSPILHGVRGVTLAAWLVPAHPVFAINAPLRATMGNWSEQAMAYRLTSLTDDIAYAAPQEITRSVLVHAMIGSVLIAAGMLIGRRSKSSRRS